MYSEKLHYTNPNYLAHIFVSKKWVKGVVSEMHIHPEIEFLYVLSGNIKISTEGGEIEAEEGDICFINGGVPHGTEFLNDTTRQAVIHFLNPTEFKGSFKYLSYLLKDSSINIHLFKNGSADYKQIQTTILDMLDRYKSDKVADELFITSCIYRLMSVIYDGGYINTNTSGIDFKLLSKLIPVFEYIDANYQENLSLEELSRTINLNKDYFCRLFKQATGTTVIDFVNMIKLRKAEELFTTEMNMSEIAFAVGFSSVSYFNCVFKKYYRCTPSYYRKYYAAASKKGV